MLHQVLLDSKERFSKRVITYARASGNGSKAVFTHAFPFIEPELCASLLLSVTAQTYKRKKKIKKMKVYQSEFKCSS
ncbi:hypothetical protein Pfo_006107 [Paulownia fortunei]|nr:hypothetical protein Pfo_006107 [Paulownia fortunei]